MKKTLMILGAGIGQLPAIRKAKAKGYKVIATSNRADDVGMAVADIPLLIDTRDVLKTLQAAHHYKIDGVLTLSTSVSMPGLGKVVDELKLVGPSYQAALYSTDKILMKERLLASKVPTARSCVVKNFEEARVAIQTLGLPVMVKAADNSGSKGVTKVEQAQELASAIEEVRRISRIESFLVEEFLDGTVFGAEAWVYQGELKRVFPDNTTVTSPPCIVPIGHSYPMDSEDLVGKEIFDIVARCVKALEIDNSMLNVDLMMTSSGPQVIEIRASMGSTCLPELTTIYSGIDWVDAAIEMVMGNKVAPEEKIEKQPCAGLLIRSAKTGTLLETGFPDELREDSRVVAIRWDKKKGERVRRFHVGPDRIGEIIVKGSSSKEAEDFCKEIESRLTIQVKEDDEVSHTL